MLAMLSTGRHVEVFQELQSWNPRSSSLLWRITQNTDKNMVSACWEIMTLRLSNRKMWLEPVSGSNRLTWCLLLRPLRVKNVCKQAKSGSDRDSES